MKKFIISAILLVAGASFAIAQESQKSDKFSGTIFSRENACDLGLTYGWGSNMLGQFLGGVLDLNAANSNFRVRGYLGSMERLIKPYLAADAQYLFPITEHFYIYPTLGLYGEYHDTESWVDNEGKGKFGVGVEGGAGLEYQFSSKFGIFAEGRYQALYGVANRPEANVGIIFHLGEGKRGAEARAAAAAAAALAAEQAARAAAEKAAAEKAEQERLAAERAAAEKAAAEKAAAEKAAAEAARIAARQATENVLFELGKYKIRDCELGKIENIVKVMEKYPEAVLTVSGYADKETGSEKLNMELSKNRAEVVANAIIEAGVDASRVSTEYFGDKVNPFPTPEANRVAVCVTK